MRQTPLKTELLELARLAAPLAAFHAGTQLMGFVDTAIVGRLGAAELGAVGLAGAVFFALSVVGMGIMMGLDPLVAQALGAGDQIRARRLLWQGIWLACAISAALALPLLATVPLLGAVGLPPEVAGFARKYLLIRAPGMLPLLLFVGTRSYLQALGRTGALVTAVVVSNVFNFAADWILVFGGTSLPAWSGPLRALPSYGVAGAAAATTLCTLVGLAIAVVAVCRAKVEGFSRPLRRASRADMRRAFRIGLPIGLQMAAEVGIFTLVAFLAGRLGKGPLAAHQIALTLAGFTFSVALGIGAAGSVRVGRAIGACDAPGTRRAGITALAAGVGFMALSAVFFFLFPEALAAVLSDSREVIAVAAPLVTVAAFFQLSDGLQAVGAGILRGAGDTRYPFVANLLGHYAVGLPVAVGLGVFGGFGVSGLWWGLCAGLTSVGIALSLRFLRLSSKPIRPLAQPEPSGGAPRPEAEALG